MFLVLPQLAHAATYYVDRSIGSDSNSSVQAQSEDTPWLTIQKCADAMTTSGNTCLIKNGTYPEHVWIKFSGASGSPNVYKAYPGHFPVIDFVQPSDSLTSRIRLQPTAGGVISYITVEGLQVKDASTAFQFANGEALIFRNNYVNTTNAQGFLGGCYNCVIEGNKIYFAGGHNADQSTSNSQYHGMYLSGQNWVIRRNLVVGSLGWGLQINAATQSNCGCTTANQAGFSGYVGNNTFAYGINQGGIVVWKATTALRIENNLFYENAQARTGTAVGINWVAPYGTQTTVKNNYSYSTGNSTGFITDSGAAENTNYTQSGNRCNAGGDVTCSATATNPLFVNGPSTYSATIDLTLTSTSPVIGVGLVNEYADNGAAPEAGAHETLGGYSSATANESHIDVTIAMDLNVPLLPASGMTGWTVKVNAVSRTVLSAAKLTGTDSVVRITFDGAVCAGGETWTVSYSGSGNVTDSALIGGTSNQPMFAFTDQAVTNNCGSAPPPDPETPYFHLTLDDGSSGTTPTTAEDESANNEDGTLTNGPTWVTGKLGSAVQFADQGDDYIAVAHGSGVNPSTQSITVCMGVKMDAGLEAATRTFFGASLGTNQRFYLSNITGTWSMAIQSSQATSNSDFPVTAGWHYLCLVMNSGTDVATLYVDGVAGTGAQSVKSYTSYTFASDVTFGRANSFGDSVSGGVTIDEPRWYNAALSQANIDDLIEIWEQTSPTPTGTYEQKTHKWQRLRKTGAGAAEDFTISGTANGITISVVPGGAVELVTQIDCTAADCDPSGLKLYYNVNSGTFIPLPDEFATDNVAFYGTTSDPDVVSGTVTCCLTGALTANDGSTQLTASAVPVFDIAQNASFVRRSVIKFDTDVTVGNTYCFKEYHQTDVALNGGYTPSAGACLTIGGHNAGVGF
jgi:hypothetical protein